MTARAGDPRGPRDAARGGPAAPVADARNRLQPALLDRLTDDTPGKRVEAEDRRVMTKAQVAPAAVNRPRPAR